MIIGKLLSEVKVPLTYILTFFRLLFKDLNDKAILNGVNMAELLGIWSPELKFLNALGI